MPSATPSTQESFEYTLDEQKFTLKAITLSKDLRQDLSNQPTQNKTKIKPVVTPYNPEYHKYIEERILRSHNGKKYLKLNSAVKNYCEL